MNVCRMAKLAATLSVLLAGAAHAEGRLVIYCTVTNAACENAAQEFGTIPLKA